MKTIEFETYVEIPITVVAVELEPEGDGWHEPHVPKHVSIYSVRVTENLDEYIKKEHGESLVEEARGMFDD